VKLFLDDLRTTPAGWQRAYSVNEAIKMVEKSSKWDEVSLDHDLGDYAEDGGDAIKFVDWMVATGNLPRFVHIHTSNPVGRDNMRRTLIRHGYQGSGTTLSKEEA
jgi:hypothetical protein